MTHAIIISCIILLGVYIARNGIITIMFVVWLFAGAVVEEIFNLVLALYARILYAVGYDSTKR